jgi:hypothetical protein
MSPHVETALIWALCILLAVFRHLQYRRYLVSVKNEEISAKDSEIEALISQLRIWAAFWVYFSRFDWTRGAAKVA